MTPAINLAKKKKVSHTIHQYEHDPNHNSYGLEAAQALGTGSENSIQNTAVLSQW